MDAHLERESEQESGNHRNCHNRKRVLTDDGALDLEVPRDRHGRFEPPLVEKYARRLPGFVETAQTRFPVVGAPPYVLRVKGARPAPR